MEGADDIAGGSEITAAGGDDTAGGSGITAAGIDGGAGGDDTTEGAGCGRGAAGTATGWLAACTTSNCKPQFWQYSSWALFAAPQFGQLRESTSFTGSGGLAAWSPSVEPAHGSTTAGGEVNSATGEGGGGGELTTGASCTPQFWQNISPGTFELPHTEQVPRAAAIN